MSVNLSKSDKTSNFQVATRSISSVSSKTLKRCLLLPHLFLLTNFVLLFLISVQPKINFIAVQSLISVTQ